MRIVIGLLLVAIIGIAGWQKFSNPTNTPDPVEQDDQVSKKMREEKFAAYTQLLAREEVLKDNEKAEADRHKKVTDALQLERDNILKAKSDLGIVTDAGAKSLK